MHDGPSELGGSIPPVAYQLADHLDSALAAAEDLTAAGRMWADARAAAAGDATAEMVAERNVVERVRTFEAMLIARVVKARKRAMSLTLVAGDFAGMTRLFVGGTAALVDAVDELGDTTRSDFDTADSILAYLRRRGVVGEDAADLPNDRGIRIGDDSFLVAGRIPLAPLVEMIGAFLDALEGHYDLYPGATPDEDTDDAMTASIAGLADIAASARRVAASIEKSAAKVARGAPVHPAAPAKTGASRDEVTVEPVDDRETVADESLIG